MYQKKVCIYCYCCLFLYSAKLSHNGHRLVYYHLPSMGICGNMKWPHCGEQSQEAFWSWFNVYSCLFLPYVVSWDPGPANTAHKKMGLVLCFCGEMGLEWGKESLQPHVKAWTGQGLGQKGKRAAVSSESLIIPSGTQTRLRKGGHFTFYNFRKTKTFYWT